MKKCICVLSLLMWATVLLSQQTSPGTIKNTQGILYIINTATGDTITANSTKAGFLINVLTTVERDALSLTSSDRVQIYNSTDSAFQVWDGSSWSDVGSSVSPTVVSIWLPAASWLPDSTSPPGLDTLSVSTESREEVYEFDGTTAERLVNSFYVPPWVSTLDSVKLVTSTESTSGDTSVFSLFKTAVASGETHFGALADSQGFTTIYSATPNLRTEKSISSFSGTYAAEDLVYLELKRDPTNALDTETSDVVFHGLLIYSNVAIAGGGGGGSGDITAVTVSAPVTGGGVTGSVNVAVDTSSGAANLATQYYVTSQGYLPAATFPDSVTAHTELVVWGDTTATIATQYDISGFGDLSWSDTTAAGGVGIATAYDISGFGTGDLSWSDTTAAGGVKLWTMYDMANALTGNTETLITVTWQVGDNTIDFVVNNDLSAYSNATSKFYAHSDTTSTLATQADTLDYIFTQYDAISGYQPLDADLTTLSSPTAWRVFYSDGSSVITELALGASGTFLKSNGASAAPTFDTPAGTGDMLKSVYDTANDGKVNKAQDSDSLGALPAADYLTWSDTTAAGGVGIATAYDLTAYLQSSVVRDSIVQVFADSNVTKLGDNIDLASEVTGTLPASSVGNGIVSSQVDSIGPNGIVTNNTLADSIAASAVGVAGKTNTLPWWAAADSLGNSDQLAVAAIVATDTLFKRKNDGTLEKGLVSTIPVAESQVTFNTNDGSRHDHVLVDVAGGTAGANVFDFGGATSLELPNGANPTTDATGEIAYDSDDEAIEVYNSTRSASMLVSPLQERTMTIIFPDTVQSLATTHIEVFRADAIKYPGGATVVQVAIQLEGDAAYQAIFEEWTGDPIAQTSQIDTVATGAADTYAESIPITDKVIAADNTLMVELPTTNVDKVTFITYWYINENN